MVACLDWAFYCRQRVDRRHWHGASSAIIIRRSSFVTLLKRRTVKKRVLRQHFDATNSRPCSLTRQPLPIGGCSGALGSGCVIIPRVCAPHANPAKLSMSISTHGIPPNPACPSTCGSLAASPRRVIPSSLPGNAGPDLGFITVRAKAGTIKSSPELYCEARHTLGF